MIAITSWPPEIQKDEKAQEILTRHLNHTVLKRLFLPIMEMIDQHSEDKLETLNLEDVYKKVSITDDRSKEARKNIESLLEKIDTETLEDLTIEEKYAFFQLLFPLVEFQEREISAMYDKEGTKGIKDILDLYKMQDKSERDYIINTIEKTRTLRKNHIRKTLNYKSNKYATSVSNAIDNYNMFLFEYPAMPATLFFSEQEYMILSLLEQEKALRKE